MPLPVRRGAGDHRGRAGRVDAQDRRLPPARHEAEGVGDGARREAADLDVRGEADPAVVAAGRGVGPALLEPGVIGELEGAVERPLVVARVVGQPARGRVREAGDEVPAPDLDRIDPELVGEQVDHPLDEMRGLGTAGPAVGVDRRRVGEHVADGDVLLLDVVRARGHEQREVRDRRGQQLQVGAHVLDQLAAEGLDAAVLVRGHLDVLQLVAAVDRRVHGLRSPLNPLDGPAGQARGLGQRELLGVDLELRAEAPAHVRRDDPHLALGHAAVGGHEGAHEVRDLGARCRGRARRSRSSSWPAPRGARWPPASVAG